MPKQTQRKEQQEDHHSDLTIECVGEDANDEEQG